MRADRHSGATLTSPEKRLLCRALSYDILPQN